MYAIISPAKKLDETPFSNARTALPLSEPTFLGDAETIVDTLRPYSAEDLSALMRISPKLGTLNHERFAAWTRDHSLGVQGAKPAALLYSGDTYVGLDALTLSADDLIYGQEHLGLISGLYGVLRPLDTIQPYRLEMKTKFDVGPHRDLYAYWEDRLATFIDRQTATHRDRTVFVLASNEYSKAALNGLESPIVQVDFREVSPDGSSKIIGLYAKRARGMMARYLLTERPETPEAMRRFTGGGYRFSDPLSQDNHWVFTRPRPTKKA